MKPQPSNERSIGVAVAGRRAAGGDVAAEVGASFIRADITSENEVRAMFEQASEMMGGLDVLVLNAGIDPGMAPMTEVAGGDFERNLDVNMRHVWWGLVHGPPHLADGGSIITTSSTVAVYKVPNISHYAAAKAAVVSLIQSAALELAHRGIRANAVLPGTTLSEMTPPDHWELPVMQKIAAPREACRRRAGSGGALSVPGERRIEVHHRAGDRRRRRHDARHELRDSASARSPG